MSNTFFQFKHFTIHHDRCAMKVGTDGVLLGAWAPIEGCRHALDVGTGSGLIALQLAQRCPTMQVTAVEIDADAAGQAVENAAHSPWAERITVLCKDFKEFAAEENRFDLIVSNPPYFVDALRCPNGQRNAARHADMLNYEQLFECSARLLEKTGRVCVIVPSEVEQMVIDAAGRFRLFLSHRLRVFTKPGKPCRRVLLSFSFPFFSGSISSFETNEVCKEETLCIEGEHHHDYSPEYVALVKDFYLKM